MTYVITEHTKKQARKLGVTVKPSSRQGKKIDVIKAGQKVASIGDRKYPDFGTYLNMERSGRAPKGTADDRRRAYKARHGHYPMNSPGYWADKLLW